MSRQNQIVLKIREMIVTGQLTPGERVAEIPVAEQLGVSRTPVRYALGVLAREGLVEPTSNNRGFIVREFSTRDILDAIRLRGVLEGVAARQLAEAGLPADVEQALSDCVEQGRAIFQKPGLTEDDGVIWAEVNEQFHRLIVEAGGTVPLRQALDLNDRVPFASAGAFLDDPDDSLATKRQYEILFIAQKQHEAILNALRRGESARVEALMREHAHVAFENIELFKDALAPASARRNGGQPAP